MPQLHKMKLFFSHFGKCLIQFEFIEIFPLAWLHFQFMTIPL